MAGPPRLVLHEALQEREDIMKCVITVVLHAEVEVEVLGPTDVRTEVVGRTFNSVCIPTLVGESADVYGKPGPLMSRVIFAAVQQGMSDAFADEMKQVNDAISNEVNEQKPASA